MTFKRFEELLKNKFPDASACAHGKFAGTQTTKQVEIHFCPGGKCYCYYGSYQDILLGLGIKVVYQKDIDWCKKHLEELQEQHGKPNRYSLFNKKPVDNTHEIEHYKELIRKYEEEYTII